MSCVVAALVEGEDGNKAYTRLGNIQDISQFQSVSTSKVEIDVTNPNCVDSGPSQVGLAVGPGPHRLPAGIPVGIPAGNLTHGSGSA